MKPKKRECKHRWYWLATGFTCMKCFASLKHEQVARILNAPKVKYRKVGTVEALALLDEVKMFGNRATPIFVHSPRKVRI